MSGGGNGNFGNGQFGGLPLGGGSGGQGTVPGRPQMPGQGGGFGQARPPMMGNRPMYQTPFTGMQTGGSDPMQGSQMPSTASPYGGPDSRPMSAPPPFQPFPQGASMGFSPQGTPGQNPMQMGIGQPPRVAPMQPPSAADGYGSDFLFRAMRGG